MRLVRRLALFVLHVVAVIAMLWAAGAFYYDLPAPGTVRSAAALAWLAAGIAAWFFLKPRWRFRAGVGGGFALILGWWLTIAPRQDRDWRPDVAVLAYAEIDGDRFTLHHVRDFEYRTETDYTPRYYTRTYHFSELRGIDVFLTYWGLTFMAHPIFSFDFGEQGRLCFSVETRPERGEGFSMLGGLYRQFELIYIPADERDVIRLRTNYRQGEEVYLYHLKVAPDKAKARLLEYLHRLNQLHAKATWYNAVADNCTTSLRLQRTASDRAPWDWRILLNGYSDEMFYARGAFDTSLPFAELKRRSHINDAAHGANEAADFSAIIRAGRPGFPAVGVPPPPQ